MRWKGEKMDIKKYCIPKEEYNIPLVNEGIQEGRKLVFCKDCKYWVKRKDYKDLCTYWAVNTEEMDFCSRGEKE